MKPLHVLAIVLLIVGALSLGWFFDTQSPLLIENPLEVPENIDYYLSGVRYRAMNGEGSIRYQLDSPYLEHFIQEDISVIRQPFIDYQGKPQRWTLSAQQGVLQHQSEVFELQEQVNLTRFDANDRMQLSTERMILTTQNDLVVIPQRLQLSTGSLQLQANSATLDVSNNQYRFNGVKATYQDRGIHETG